MRRETYTLRREIRHGLTDIKQGRWVSFVRIPEHGYMRILQPHHVPTGRLVKSTSASRRRHGG